MIEADLAAQWASIPDFPKRLASWTWFKLAVSECVISIARRLQFRCELHRGDLAIAFFQWAGHADGSLEFSKQLLTHADVAVAPAAARRG